MNNFTPLIFTFDQKDEWQKYLENEGYVVINRILEEDVRKELIEQFWKDWNYVSPNFKRDDMESWNIGCSPIMYAKGIACFSGFAHSDFMWNFRLQKNIIKIFEEIHKTDKLVVSFDGFSVFFEKKQKTKPWWHIDQHPDNKAYCIQGAYNFFEVKQDSAGFIVVPKSHKKNLNISTSSKKDWITFEEDSYIKKEGVKLLIPENSMVLWNSKTIHANTGMKAKEKRFDRLTVYVCYMPKKLRPEHVLQEKIQAYNNAESCSHWANKCEVKKYPWGFGPQYDAKNFKKIVPLLPIPEERLKYF